MINNSLFKIVFILFFSFLFIFSLKNFNNLALAENVLEPPFIIYPKANEEVWAGAIKFDWSDTETNFYKYHINLPDGTSKEEVVNVSFKETYDLKVGNYSWGVSSCQDSGGENCGGWSNTESFSVIESPARISSGGLVPCGRKYDNLQTPNINEAEPCGLKHIFLLLKNTLDFLLWRLGLIILVLLIMVTGVISYFSMGAPTIIVRVKSLLKSAMVGYGVIFLAWIIINWILVILGFQVGIFGKWWQISF